MIGREPEHRCPYGAQEFCLFIRQVMVPAGLARTRRAAVGALAPALSAMGFELLEQSDAGLIFERVSRSGWFSTTRERVVISLEKQGLQRNPRHHLRPRGSCCPKAIRHAQLLSQPPRGPSAVGQRAVMCINSARRSRRSTAVRLVGGDQAIAAT